MKRLQTKIGNSNIIIVYAGEELPKSFSKSLYLAGPTPRSNAVKSWRTEALQILDDLNYDGVVFVPEARDGKNYPEYDNQITWEQKMLNVADCILFWINRELRDDFENIGLTTNIEWGEWLQSGKIVVGFPEESCKNNYIKYQCDELQIEKHNTLKKTINAAINMIGKGSLRKHGECFVPLYVWNTDMFQSWYQSQKSVGNELKYARVNYLFKMPKAKKVFLWILHVHVYIKSENRIKENEFVLARTDISTVVLYKKGKSFYDTEVVLVKEFRSPVNNKESIVYELPGGSSITDKDSIDVIKEEVYEEVGLVINKSRFKYHGSRQMVATLSSHKAHVYFVELTNEELDFVKNDNNTHGVYEDSELTYSIVLSLQDILSNNLLDYSNIGMIFSVLNN